MGQVSGAGEQGHENYKGIVPTRRKRLSTEEVQGPEVLCAGAAEPERKLDICDLETQQAKVLWGITGVWLLQAVQ